MNSNVKMVLVNYQTLTAKIEEDFYIDKALSAGISVEYWDLTRIFNKGLKVHGSLQRDYIKQFNTLAAVQAAVKNSSKDTLFIILMTFEWKIVRLMRIFTVYDRKTAFFARGMLPFPLLHESFLTKLYHKVKLLVDYKYVSNYVSNKAALLAKRLNWIKSHDLLFCAGSEGYHTVGVGAHLDALLGKTVPINSADFDKMKAVSKRAERTLDFRYAVFLDIYLPYHPDLAIIKADRVDADPYYTALNRFFNTVEEQYDVKVVIAAHPKADYSSNPFDGRLIVKAQTAELVMYSEFVIAHHSTSISFAVLFEKPLIFIYDNEMQRAYEHSIVPLIASFSEVLNASVYNISDGQVRWELKPVNKDRYNDYKYKYLTSPETEHTFTEDVVVETIRSIKAGNNG